MVLASLTVVEDSSWYPNSGATHQVTHAYTNLAQVAPYIRKGHVIVGNDSSLSISSIGSSSRKYSYKPPVVMKPFVYFCLH